MKAKLPNLVINPAQTLRIKELNHCVHRNCPLRKIFLKGDYFTGTTTQRRYHKNHVGNCTTQNLVYMLTCTICQSQYVGQTKRQLKVRISEHLADIRYKRDTPVAHHFNKAHHNHSVLRCEILEVIKGDPESNKSKSDRDLKEQFWIHQLQTKHPNGINKRD